VVLCEFQEAADTGASGCLCCTQTGYQKNAENSLEKSIFGSDLEAFGNSLCRVIEKKMATLAVRMPFFY
jgi:hypothetical protein